MTSLNKPSMRLTGLPPVCDIHTRVLILGTFPAIESLKHRRYYANIKNHFWDVIVRCLDPSYPPYIPIIRSTSKPDYSLLLLHHVGIWDVIESCEREGNRDADITNPMFNDLETFIKEHELITQIAYNGGNALKFFNQAKQQLPERIEYNVLNSTSTLNTNNTFIVLEQWMHYFANLKF